MPASPRNRRLLLSGLLCLFACAISTPQADEPPTASPQAAEKRALGALQICIGSWKGVGQPKRGSIEGAWVESAEWAWSFARDRAEHALKWTGGKYFRAARLEQQDGKFVLRATLPDGQAEAVYTGQVESQEDELPVAVFTLENPAEGAPDRITLRLVAQGDRLLLLYEKRNGDSDRYLRLAEVGYTRKGSGFGQGHAGRECIITGGAGTIPVTHNGQTYYVCCTGCKDLFEKDPDQAIAAYAKRRSAEQAKRQRAK